VVNTAHGVRSTLEIKLPDADSTVERWTVTVENLTDNARDIKVVPYLEWVLDRPESDRGHTQYGRLFPEMEYAQGGNTLLAWQKKTKTMGFLASDIATEGFHTSRMDFIGRARSLWSSRLLETLAFLDAKDTKPYPTFDPIGSLLLGVRVDAKGSRTVNFLVGYAKDRDSAMGLIQKHLSPKGGTTVADKNETVAKTGPLVGHGEIPPGTPLPYSVYKDGGNTLGGPYAVHPAARTITRSPTTVGHYVMVTNRGLHTTSNGNSQQNPITHGLAGHGDARSAQRSHLPLRYPRAKSGIRPRTIPLNDLDGRYTNVFSALREQPNSKCPRGSGVHRIHCVSCRPSEPTGVYHA
jgi:cyclic beta-1,2-glucan synthetase